MIRIFGYLVASVLAVSALYVSRFWLWSLPWSKKGLWGFQELSPNGDVLRRLLRRTPLEVFDLVIWLGLVFIVLSLVQWLVDRVVK